MTDCLVLVVNIGGCHDGLRAREENNIDNNTAQGLRKKFNCESDRKQILARSKCIIPYSRHLMLSLIDSTHTFT